MPTARSDTNMTTAQLGRRMDRVEVDVGELKTEVAKTTSSVEGMRSDMNILFTKMDQVITSTSQVAASKDHIATKYVTWGIGLALSTLLAMVSIGITVTGAAGGVGIWAMNSGDDKLAVRFDGQYENVMSGINVISQDLKDNVDKSDQFDDRLRLLEQQVSTLGDK